MTIIKPTRLRRSLVRSWLQYLNAAVLKRALILAVAIGAVLTLITQFPALFGDARIEQLSTVLAFVTPFVVITISQLAATHQAVSDTNGGQSIAASATFISTIIAHNIPFRALMISLIIGSSIGLMILVSTFLETGNLADMPRSLLVQVYVLPFVFGALAQALTYRRHVAASP